MCGWELPLVPLRGLSRFLTQNRKVKPQSMFGAAVVLGRHCEAVSKKNGNMC